MIYLQSIPHQKVYKQRVYLPRDEKSTTMYNIIFSNNNSIDTTIELMKHPLLVTNHKYLNYYIESLYKTKIGQKTVNINYRRSRQEVYKRIDDEFKMYNTPIAFDALKNRNVYYDLYMDNIIFFKNIKATTIRKRIEMYVDYLMSHVNDPKLSAYKQKLIMIDVESWSKSKDYINSPVMYLFLAYRKFFDIFAKIGNINIIFYTQDMLLRVNPSQCTEKTFSLFKRELNKLMKTINLEDDEIIDKEVEKQDIREKLSDTVKSDVLNFVGDIDSEEGIEIDDTITDTVDDIIDDIETPELSKKEIEKKLKEKIEDEDNSELLNTIHEIRKEKALGRSTASLKRDAELREKQKKIKLHDMKLEDYEDFYSRNIEMPTIDISDKVTTTNENMKKVKFKNFEKTYNDTLMKKDLADIFTNLNDKTVPVFIKDIKVEDSSDELNYKDTYTVVLEDSNRVRHNLKFDMPKFIEDKFLYLGGNKKIIVKQLTMKPIVKISPDRVRITSNYNIIMVNRYGTKISSKIERFKKAIANSITGVNILHGDSSIVNNNYKTTLEYDELAKSILKIKTSNVEILFSQEEIHNRLKDIKLGEDDFCIGFYSGNKPIIMSYKTEKIGQYDLVDFIVANGGNSLTTAYDSITSSGKRFVYSRATIMNKNVPLILLLGYCEGLSTILKKANIEHYFTDKRPSITDQQGYIQFEDGYLVYNKYPFENSLLMNALESIPTKSFTYDVFDDKEVYIELFEILYGARNLANAFDSFYEFMIDPITKQVLNDFDYPTDFVSVLLFANSLLVDNSYVKENDMNLYRIRSNEIVNAILHKHIADAYSRYRATANNKNPVKMSIPKDAIIKEISTMSILEEFSTLNPIYESEKLRAITPKGPNGLNVENAYTQDKRSYDNTMVGLMGISTSPDANVGIVRQLTMEPNITGPRGYIDVKNDKLDDIKDVNMFTPAELLTPLGVTKDDSIRTAMASKQSKHIVPVSKSSPVLISNGAEQVIQYSLSKDFVIIAEEDGVVVDVDDETGLYIVQYKSGKVQAIDTKPKVVKNSASGFYVSNKLNTDLKKGDKVKKNDVMAYEDKFFTNDTINGNRFNIGTLVKVAIMSSYATYEDSTFITKKMSEEMSCDIVMMKDVVIGKNANVDKMVNIGDSIGVGDILVSFETSYEDDSLNKFLASVGDELQEDIKSLGRVPIKSKYSGTIEDIKIYSSVDLDDLSPSLRKIVSKYYTKINKKKKILDTYDKNNSIIKAGILFNDPTGKIKPTSDGKIKGKEVFDGVLIEFYIKYRDPVGVGDKITSFKW